MTTDFEQQKANALTAVRQSKCVGKYIQVPVEHMATITKALRPHGYDDNYMTNATSGTNAPPPTDVQRQAALDAWSYIHLFCGVHAKNERDRQALNDRFVTLHRALQSAAVPRELSQEIVDAFGFIRRDLHSKQANDAFDRALALLGGKEGR